MSADGSTPRAPRQEGELVASKYRLERPLAQGGMGSLWVARHVELDVQVAIKFSAMERSDFHDQRFRREARAAARLKSPHIVQVFDYGFDGGEPYIAMELLEGESLRELLEREGRLPLARTAALVGEIAKGLGVAHEAGIVHRDLKPSNLFLARVGTEQVVKILDFGIAKAAADTGSEAGSGAPNLGGDATRAGAIVGSPAYMSPEQAAGDRVDQRSDLWSLAVVTFRMLTGVEPFKGADAAETLERIASAPLPLAPFVPAAVADFFERGLARPKERRFQSARELSGALEQLAARDPQAPLALPVRTPAQHPADAVGQSGRRPAPAHLAVGRTGETLPLIVAPRSRSRARTLRVAAGALAFGVAVPLGLYLWANRAPAVREPAAREPDPPAARATPTPSPIPVAATHRPPTPERTASELTASATSSPAPRRKQNARPPPREEAIPATSSQPPAEPALDPVFGLQR